MLQVEKAGRILVIGGGATGTEQACEIATKYPEKQVTLVAARDYLITDKANASFQAKLLAILERLGIKVIKGMTSHSFFIIKKTNDTNSIKMEDNHREKSQTCGCNKS